MSALATLYAPVQATLLASASTALALAVAWFDPLALVGEGDEEALWTWAPLWGALGLTRHALPTVYAQVVAAGCAGQSAQTLDGLLRRAFDDVGIPVDEWEQLSYGIPLPCYGYSWEQDSQPPAALAAVVAALPAGGHPSRHASTVVLAAQALVAHGTRASVQVGWALAWLWGVTGNLCLDVEPESFYDFEPLDWTPEAVALAVSIIREAELGYAAAQAGWADLAQAPSRLAALRALLDAAQQLDKTLKQEGAQVNHEQLQSLPVDADAFGERAGGAPAVDAELLSLWHGAAPDTA